MKDEQESCYKVEAKILIEIASFQPGEVENLDI